jgi:hypothetical protein
MDVQCFGGALECRVEYPSGFVCSHIHSWPGALAHADQILRPTFTRQANPGLQTVPPTRVGAGVCLGEPTHHAHHGGGRPEFVAASRGVCPRDRVD